MLIDKGSVIGLIKNPHWMHFTGRSTTFRKCHVYLTCLISNFRDTREKLLTSLGIKHTF